MRARDGVEEDLSAYAREDLVYKAKLAEQAERCARMNASNRSARVEKEWDGRRVGTTAGCLVDDGARRADATERERPRARERERTAGVARRASSRVESSRFGSIRFDRSIERTTERMGAPIERTNDRCATRDARRRAHHVARVDACAGGGRGRGWRTRDEGRIDASPRPRADRGRGARGARARGGGNASESKRCEARGD